MVHRGSTVDAHAAVNTTSVYTAAGVFPMLPPRLSNDRTSLHEGEERLAVVVEMHLDSGGSVIDSRLYRAVVRNHVKLDYDSVASWLDAQAPPPAAIAANAALQACFGSTAGLRELDFIAVILTLRLAPYAADLREHRVRPIPAVGDEQLRGR